MTELVHRTVVAKFVVTVDKEDEPGMVHQAEALVMDSIKLSGARPLGVHCFSVRDEGEYV